MQGLIQGAAMAALARIVQSHENVRLVHYEALCTEPASRFRELAEWAGLEWTPELEERLQARSRANPERNDAYDTHRDSLAMRDAWRSRVSPDQARRLRRTFAAFNLPWYAADSDWEEGH